MKSTRWVMTYIVVASLGLWAAFFMSLKFMTPGYSQTPPAPAAGDLPPEFLQETQQQAAPGNGANGPIPPPPSEPPQVPQQVPEQTQLPPPPAPPGVPETPPQQGGAPAATPPMVPATVTNDPMQFPSEGEAPVVPQFASDDQYTFEPTGKRDPFRPFRKYRPANPISGGQGGPAKIIDETDPLQRWDLDRFAVVAIMWEIRNPKAMVRDPDGKTFMIGKGTRIGRNSGQVAVIREGEIAVVEQIENEGVQTKEVKILELKK